MTATQTIDRKKIKSLNVRKLIEVPELCNIKRGKQLKKAPTILQDTHENTSGILSLSNYRLKIKSEKTHDGRDTLKFDCRIVLLSGRQFFHTQEHKCFINSPFPSYFYTNQEEEMHMHASCRIDNLPGRKFCARSRT
jgi:hypothetical protein